MGKSYKYDAFIVPKIFEDLVNEVSINLASEPSLSIPNVSFKHGRWIDIKKELMEQGNSPEQIHRDTKYPLICLIHSFDESYTKGTNQIKVDLLILTATSKNEYIPYKYNHNYANILNPIYSELVQVIKNSNSFSGYLDNMKFPKRDLNHLGNEGEQNAYGLPDILDGIVMENLEFKLARPKCSPTPCVQLYQIDSLSCISSVEMSGSGIDLTASISFMATSDPSTTYEIACDDAHIRFDALPNTPYQLNFSSLGANATNVVEIIGSDGSIVTIPLVIQDGRYFTYGFNTALDLTINTSCGGYMPINMNSYAELLGASPNQIDYTEVKLNNVGVYHHSEGLSNFAQVTSSMIGNFVLPEIIGDLQPIEVIYTLSNGQSFTSKALILLGTI